MSDVITAGLLGFGGSMMSGLFGQSSADAAMAFQREAMQNRYQWTMQDLRKAGLNPMLAIGGMTGSGIPSGATARMDNPGAAAVQSATAVKAVQIAERQQHNQDIQAQSVVGVNEAQSSKLQAETLNEYLNISKRLMRGLKLKNSTMKCLYSPRCLTNHHI